MAPYWGGIETRPIMLVFRVAAATIMTRPLALSLLGFPANSQPTEAEIQSAFRKQVVQKHPDRGGDPEEMALLNAAETFLTNKAQEKTSDSVPTQTKVKDVVIRSFSEAWKVPASVNWLLHSVRVADFGSPAQNFLFGETDSKYVAVLVLYSRKLVNRLNNVEWTVTVAEAAKNNSALKTATTLFKELAANADVKAPTKFFMWDGPNVPTENSLMKAPRSGGSSLAAILTGLGLAESAKTSVNITFKHDPESDSIFPYSGTLSINGKPVALSPATMGNLESFIYAGFKGAVKVGTEYNISQKRNAASLLTLLSDALTDEPSWVHLALAKAAEGK